MELVTETLLFFESNSYPATCLKFSAKYAATGFSVFPPRGTLDRWAAKFDLLEPVRGVQGGPKPTLLTPQQRLTLRVMIMSTRRVGVPVHWRTVRIYVIGLLRFASIFLAPGKPSKSYCSTVLSDFGMTLRKGTKSARRETPEALEAIETKHLLKLAFYVARGRVPNLLVFNFDEQGLPMWNCSKNTMEIEGATEVPIKGLDDKRQITVGVFCDASGQLLRAQTIWAGVMGRTGAVPLKKMPAHLKAGLNVQTPTHWQNRVTFQQWLEDIFLPHVVATRKVLMSPPDQRAVLLLDLHTSHTGPSTKQFLRDNNVDVIWIFPGLTGQLQPCDISYQGHLKMLVRQLVDDKFAEDLFAHLQAGNDAESFELALTKSKLEGPFCEALSTALQRLASDECLAVRLRGWRDALIAWNPEFQARAQAAFGSGELFDHTLDAAVDSITEVAAEGDADARQGGVPAAATEVAEQVGDDLGDDLGDAEDDVAVVSEQAEEEEDDDGFEEDAVPAPIVPVFSKVVDIRVITQARSEYRVEFENPPGQGKWVTQEDLDAAGKGHLIAQFIALPRAARRKN